MTAWDPGPPRVVVFRLVGGEMEGQWREVDRAPAIIPRGPREALPEDAVIMVATGSVEWNGDRCAEVYVPKDLLWLWRAEHEDAEDSGPG